MEKSKEKTIKLETIAKTYSNPKQFVDDLMELHTKYIVFKIKYGSMGLYVFESGIEQYYGGGDKNG